MASLPSMGNTQIQMKFMFGLNSKIRNNIYFQQEEKIIYPAGYNVVLYDLKDQSQLYYQGTPDYLGISCMTLSPLRQHLAIGVLGMKSEKGGSTAVQKQRPGIIIFDTFTQKRRKSLPYNQPNVKRWVSLAFAPDKMESQTLISLSGGGGDVLACLWKTTKNAIICFTKISQSFVDATEIAFNPMNASIFTVIGQKVFQCYTKFDEIEERDGKTEQKLSVKNICQQLNGAPPDLSTAYTCHAWLSCENFLVVGTSNGEIILCDDQCDYQGVIHESPIHKLQQVTSVECICVWSQGFVVGTENAYILVYRNTMDDKNPFEVTHAIDLKKISSLENQDFGIKGVAVSIHSEDTIICTLSSNVVVSVRLKKGENNTHSTSSAYSFDEPSEEPVLITPGFHSEGITGMDICIRKPLIATCAADKTIKVWNYEEKTLELSWSYSEEPSVVAFHPSGFHMVVAFTDRLKWMNILLHNNNNANNSNKTNKHYKEINPFQGCKEIKFSNGGHLFAASMGQATSHSVIIFQFYTGETYPWWSQKGHSGRIRSLAWSKDDTILYVGGLDCIYGYKVDDISNEKVFNYHSQSKGTIFTSICITPDMKRGFACGTDHQLHTFDPLGVEKEQKPLDMQAVISQIALPGTNKILFCGMSDPSNSSGSIRCYTNPIVTGKYNEYIAHDEKGISLLRMTYDDHFLISAGNDGCLIVFEIKDKDARGMKLKDGYAQHSQEILVTQADLEDLKTSKDTQKMTLSEKTTENQNMLNTTGKDEPIKELKDRLEVAMNQYKANYEALEEQKKELEKKFEEDLRGEKMKNEVEIQELDNTYQKQVIQQYEKFESEQDLYGIEQTQNAQAQANLLQQHASRLRQMEEEYQSRLEDEKSQRFRVQKQTEDQMKKNGEMISQIEQETRDEIGNLQKRMEEDKNKIEEQTLSAKSEYSIAKQKIATQTQQIQDKEERRKQRQEQSAQLKADIEAITKKIHLQRKDMDEQDKIIGEKERKIYELKKRSQELEKFKFVLDHKIKELKKDIGPRETIIKEMKDETNQMDETLKKLNNLNNSLGTVVEELNNKQKMMKEQIEKQRAQIADQNGRIKRFQDDVYAAVQYILDYDQLQGQVEDLKNKYYQPEVQPPKMEENIEQEYISQQNYLAKSVRMLKKNLLKDNEIHKQDNIRIMRENVELIKEINLLRQQQTTDEQDSSQDHHINKQKQSQKEMEEQEQFIKQAISTKQNHLETLKEDNQNLSQIIAELERELQKEQNI